MPSEGIEEELHDQLSLLLRHYAALSPSSPALIPPAAFPPPLVLSQPSTQQWLVDNALGHDAAEEQEQEEGARNWKRGFWRRILGGIDHGFTERKDRGEAAAVEDEETHPDLLESFVELMSTTGAGGSGVPGVSRRTYFWGPLRVPPSSWQRIATREEGRLISAGTTGLRTWQACVALANHLLAEPALVRRHQRILELGAGVGLLSLVSARLTGAEGGAEEEKPSRIIATDVDHKVLKMLAQNIAENGFEDRLQARMLDWELASDTQHNAEQLAAWERTAGDSAGRASLVLGADIVYDPSLVGPLSATLCWLLRPDTTIAPEALVAGTVRNEATWESFLSSCQSYGLRVEPVAMRSPPDSSGIVGAEGWEGEGSVRLVRITAGAGPSM